MAAQARPARCSVVQGRASGCRSPAAPLPADPPAPPAPSGSSLPAVMACSLSRPSVHLFRGRLSFRRHNVAIMQPDPARPEGPFFGLQSRQPGPKGRPGRGGYLFHTRFKKGIGISVLLPFSPVCSCFGLSPDSSAPIRPLVPFSVVFPTVLFSSRSVILSAVSFSCKCWCST